MGPDGARERCANVNNVPLLRALAWRVAPTACGSAPHTHAVQAEQVRPAPRGCQLGFFSSSFQLGSCCAFTKAVKQAGVLSVPHAAHRILAAPLPFARRQACTCPAILGRCVDGGGVPVKSLSQCWWHVRGVQPLNVCQHAPTHRTLTLGLALPPSRPPQCRRRRLFDTPTRRLVEGWNSRTTDTIPQHRRLSANTCSGAPDERRGRRHASSKCGLACLVYKIDSVSGKKPSQPYQPFEPARQLIHG